MYKRNLLNGDWHKIDTEGEFGRVNVVADIHKGCWYGPGYYLGVPYSQLCTRGCCHESVFELVSADNVAFEVAEIVSEWEQLLSQAKQKSGEESDENLD